jgi:uncharacterized protein (PEP-CTERM system associated)
LIQPFYSIGIHNESSGFRSILSAWTIAGLLLAAPVLAQDDMSSTTGPISAQPNGDTGEGGSVSSAGISNTAPAPKRAWTITPNVTLEEIYSDNINLSPSNLAVSELVTEIAPGITIEGATKRLKAHLDYQAKQFIYGNQDNQNNNLQNSLNAFGTLELVENWLFLDANGSIGQQSLSAFGGAPGPGYAINQNSTETRNWSVSPYIKGRFWDEGNYEFRYQQTKQTTSSSSASGYSGDQLSGKVGSSIANSKLGWSVNYTRSNNSYNATPDSQETTLSGLLVYRFDPQLNLSLGVVNDKNDYAGGSVTSNGPNIILDWKPSPRTAMLAQWQKRTYGSTYNYSLSHRTPLSEVAYTLNRGITTQPNSLTYAGYGGLYDLLYLQLASSYPDPNARQTATQNLLNEYGLPANSTAPGEYLQNQVTLQKRQTLSYIKRGVRDVLTVSYTQTNSNALSTSSLLGASFGTISNIKQDGINVNLSHKLSGKSNLSATCSYLRSQSDDLNNFKSTQSMYGLSYAATLGQKSAFSASLNRNRFSASTSSYTENSITLLLSHRF